MPQRRLPSKRQPNRPREIRQDRGLSMAQLAHAVTPTTTAATIDKLEKGEMGLTVDWMYRLAGPLGCHPSEFLPDSLPMTSGEKAVLERLRGLDEPDRQRFEEVLDAWSGSAGALVPPRTSQGRAAAGRPLRRQKRG